MLFGIEVMVTKTDFHSIDCRRASTVLTIYFYKLLARDLTQLLHTFSVLFWSHVLHLHGQMHALPSLSLKGSCTGIDLEPLYFSTFRAVSQFKCLTSSPQQLASGVWKGFVSPFVLQFHRNERILKPVDLSVLCRVQVHWLSQNPKFQGSLNQYWTSDNQYYSLVPCAH